MKLDNNKRSDLNIAHLVARSGIFKDFNKELLSFKNKNNWLPFHLVKNDSIAKRLLSDSMEYTNLGNLIVPAIKNNVQSVQTKYGKDLELVLLDYDFNTLEAKLGSAPPNDRERSALAHLLINSTNKNMLELFDFNPLEEAIKYSNFYFLKSIFSLEDNVILNNFPIDSSVLIGSDFFVGDLAFKIKMLLRQKTSKNFSISNSIVYKNESTTDYYGNLEGA